MSTLEKAELYNKEGDNQFAQKYYKNALTYYDRAIKVCPQIAKYYSSHAECNIFLGNFISAQQYAKICVTHDPGSLKAYIQIAQCGMALGNILGAAEAIKTAKGIYPDDKKLLELSQKIDKLNSQYQTCILEMENMNYRSALKSATSCQNICDGEVINSIHYLLLGANCFFELKEYSEAEHIANLILKKNVNEEKALYIKYSSQFYQQDIRTGIEIIKKLKLKLPDHLETSKIYKKAKQMFELITLAERTHNVEEKYIFLRKAVSTDPINEISNKNLYKMIIDVTMESKDTMWNAYINCSDYMHNYGRDINILKKRARCSAQLEEYEDALEDCDEILKVEKNEEFQKLYEEMKEKYQSEQSDVYKLLRVDKKDDLSIIRKSYNNMIKFYHTDKNTKASPEVKKRLERRTSTLLITFKKIEKEKLKK